MTEQITKAVTLQAYDLENGEMHRPYSDLMEKLAAKLSAKGEMAGNRRLILNEESNEEDLLSSYSIKEKFIFGVMWRIIPQKEVPSIPDELFKHETIQITEIQDKEGNSILICKDHYYFALNKRFLVTNLPKSRIKSLEVYLNWLLEATRGDKLYAFTPKIEAPQGTPLSKIKNIVFADPTSKKKNKKAENTEEKSLKVFNFATERLISFLQEIPDLQLMLEKKILSAQLLVKFTKPRKMDEEDYKKLLGAYMKPVSDSDGVTFSLNNGKKIKGTEILLTKVVKVEKLDIGISEPALLQEMERFLNELN